MFGVFLSYHVPAALSIMLCAARARLSAPLRDTHACAEPHHNRLHLQRIVDSKRRRLSVARLVREDSKRRFRTGPSMGEPDFVDKDKLILRGLQFHGFHGVKPEEKKLGQKFVVDVDAWLDLSNAGKSDDISDTVSYTDIYRLVKEAVEGPSRNLLESVAHVIANTTFLKFPQISAVRVMVGKPHVAVHGTINYLGVEILRDRDQDHDKCEPE